MQFITAKAANTKQKLRVFGKNRLFYCSGGKMK